MIKHVRAGDDHNAGIRKIKIIKLSTWINIKLSLYTYI